MDDSRRSTQRITAGLAAVLAAALCLTPPATAEGLVGIGVAASRAHDVLRSHELKDLDGEVMAIESLRGEVVVINFWASWCRPCRRELPALDQLNTELRKSGGRVLAVSIDHDARNARRFAKAHKLSLPVYHDGPEGLARSLDLTSIPFTLVLDRRGKVAFTTSGSDEAALAELRTRTRKLAAKKPFAAAASGDTP